MAFEKTYARIIKPVNGPNLWPDVDYTLVLPLDEKNQPSRPKKLRRLELDEFQRKDIGVFNCRRFGQKVTCGYCKAPFHNRRDCPHAPPPSEEEKTAATKIVTPSTNAAKPHLNHQL